MLLQSHTGVVRIFPAIPAGWEDVSFEKLRAQGAFLISAAKRNGAVVLVEIQSEKGGQLLLANPFDGGEFTTAKEIERSNGIVQILFNKGESVKLAATE